jgi:hypothetical protein
MAVLITAGCRDKPTFDRSFGTLHALAFAGGGSGICELVFLEAEMFKRTMLALAFVATLGVVGVGMTSQAEAWGRWRRPWVAGYYGPPAYYYGRAAYHTYYAPQYYGPYYYRMGGPYYGGYYYDEPCYYHGGGGISVSVGF